jgi:V/A-type H+-transporting ATPase subunit E
MAIEDIVKQIEEDARSEAESLRSNAEAEAGAICEKAKRQAEALGAQETQKAKEGAEEHGRRIETLAGLELRKDILREKKDLIEDAFSRAAAEIANLPPDEYRSYIKPIILAAVESGVEEIVPSAKHRDFFTAAFLKDLNGDLNTAKAALRLSDDTGKFSGGFILRDGKKETNMTLSSMIATRRDKLEPEIAKLLFGQGS